MATEDSSSSDFSSTDDGWTEAETHWSDSYVAAPVRKLGHDDGGEIWLWTDVVEGSPEYSVTDDDEFVVEVKDPNENLIKGDAFETRDEAEEALREARVRFSDGTARTEKEAAEHDDE